MSTDPEALGEILARLFISRGWGQRQARRQLEEAWRQAAGEQAARGTELGTLRRGVLEIVVQSPVLLQELAQYRKKALLEALQGRVGKGKVMDLRFRLGALSQAQKEGEA